MNVIKEINLLLEILNISEQDLGDLLQVSYETVNKWKHGKNNVDILNIEKIYNYAYTKKIYFNLIYEQLLKEEYSSDNMKVLFHGAKKNFILPIDIDSNSKLTNDFGVGFYLGESFEQAANYIANNDKAKVHSFLLNTKNLKVIKFGVNREWMLAIAYYRGWLTEYDNSLVLKEIINKVNTADVIIAPIADNRMFDIINEFVGKTITDLQCEHALAATNLGYQYVIKTKKAIDNLKYLKEMYVSSKEKESCISNRIVQTNTSLHKVQMARIEYRGKGKYIEEIL